MQVLAGQGLDGGLAQALSLLLAADAVERGLLLDIDGDACPSSALPTQSAGWKG